MWHSVRVPPWGLPPLNYADCLTVLPSSWGTCTYSHIYTMKKHQAIYMYTAEGKDRLHWALGLAYRLNVDCCKVISPFFKTFFFHFCCFRCVILPLTGVIKYVFLHLYLLFYCQFWLQERSVSKRSCRTCRTNDGIQKKIQRGVSRRGGSIGGFR